MAVKRLKCELCGSVELVMQDGLYVCQYCRTKYTVAEARKMMIEGQVDVSGSAVKIDVSDEIAKLYQMARRARDDQDIAYAVQYYDMILAKDPASWEATFYTVYLKELVAIQHAQKSGTASLQCINHVFRLIRDYVKSQEEQTKAYTEVAQQMMNLVATMVAHTARCRNDWRFSIAAVECCYILGDNLNLVFGGQAEANRLSVVAWKQGIKCHLFLVQNGLASKATDQYQDLIRAYYLKIRKYDPNYVLDPKLFQGNRKNDESEVEQLKKGEQGCYIATAVYGSYDCPPVWTLRRYRDNTLSKTWYGRFLIHTYYAMSPTLVKWLGDTKWFQRLWRGKLDRMVAKLQAKGVESTPYEDTVW